MVCLLFWAAGYFTGVIMSREDTGNVIPYREKRRFNFITVVFCAVLVYLAVQLIGFVTADSYPIYELKLPETYSHAYERRGLVTREEYTCVSENAGFVNYLITEGRKYSSATPVYTTKDASFFTDALLENEDTQMLSTDKLTMLKERLVQTCFRSDEQFYRYAQDKEDIQATILNTFLQKASKNIDVLLRNDPDALVVSERSGFILYHQDNYCGIGSEDITPEMFREENCILRSYETGRSVQAGDFAYRIVPDDVFSLSFILTENEYISFIDRKYLPIHLKELDVDVNGSLSIRDLSDGSHMATVTLNKYGSNCLNNRFLSFSISQQEQVGYRIPVESVLTRDFITVPAAFVIHDSHMGIGVIREVKKPDGSTDRLFTRITIYAVRGNTYYISSSELTTQDTIYLPVKIESGGQQENGGQRESGGQQESGEEQETENGKVVEDEQVIDYTGDPDRPCRLSVTAPLTGVYNVNKGYCIFRQVEILTQTADRNFYLIATKTDLVLAAYDRIIQNAASVDDNRIIVK